MESGWEFYYPEMSFHEVRKYRSLVLERTGMDEQEYTELLNRLLKHITLVPEEQIKENLDEARNLLGKIDPYDVIFLAAALSIDDAKIWSDDAHFDKQSRMRVFKSKHIVKLFFPFNV